MRHANLALMVAVAVAAGSAGLAAPYHDGLPSAAQPPEKAAQAPGRASQPAFTPAWQAILGAWFSVGEDQPPGPPLATFTFNLDLDGRIIVRRNHNDIPASGDKPAAVHDDLMMIFPTERPAEWRALYADNEGHVIQYRARWSADNKRLSFVGDITPGQPRYRLVYTFATPDDLVIAFEIAPPGRPDGFKPYLTGKAKRNKLDSIAK